MAFAGVVWLYESIVLREVLPLLVSTALLFILSALEDLRGTPAALRLCVQTISATLFLWWSGAHRLSWMTGYGDGWGASIGLVLFMVWMANLYNFMDGIDGLAGGMAAIGFAFVATQAFIAGVPHIGALAALISASATGFLTGNFPPARIFLGDAGSVPIGFLAAALSLQLAREAKVDLAQPVLVFAPFIVDATVTLARRVLARERFWRPHREHWYQRLVLGGWTHRRTALLYYALMLASGGLSLLYGVAPHAVVLAVLSAHLLLPVAVNWTERDALRAKIWMKVLPWRVRLPHIVKTVLLSYHRLIAVTAHLVLVVLSNYVAFWLRFDGAVPAEFAAVRNAMLPAVVVTRITIFLPLRLFQGLWRYTSLWDLRNIIVGVSASSIVLFVAVRYGFGQANYPRSIHLIDAMLLVCLMAGVRLSRRIYREFSRMSGGRRVLLYGAGDSGEAIARELRRGNGLEYEIVGFIDDESTKDGLWIQGVRVLGNSDSLPAIMQRHAVDEVLIAIPNADFRTMRRILRSLEPFKVRITTLPGLAAILDGRVSISQARPLQVEDLLPRAPVGLDASPLDALITGRRVLVTGAGGSIGSELCRQISARNPAHLVLFDRYENTLHEMSMELQDRWPQCRIDAVVADMTDARRVAAVFGSSRPQLVFHAAAHKHVPLMETNVCEAVKNNVTGSRLIVESAIQHDVEQFVLISTDKAVNPTSIMGATKRLVEWIVREHAHASSTRFVTVRFGNVLGSNGSVLPRFVEQIKRGGPLTVTHPDVERYFMLLPEAVQLVLHAAVLNETGALYVLDMGEQLRVVDLARNLIRLAGFVPEEEIPLTFTGLRPGEKLSEELVQPDEVLEATRVPKISRVRFTRPLPPTFRHNALTIEQLAAEGDQAAVTLLLREMLPTLDPAIAAEASFINPLAAGA